MRDEKGTREREETCAEEQNAAEGGRGPMGEKEEKIKKNQ